MARPLVRRCTPFYWVLPWHQPREQVGLFVPSCSELEVYLCHLVAKMLGTFPHWHHVAFLVFFEVFSEEGTVFLMFIIGHKDTSL